MDIELWDCSGCVRYTPFIASAVGYADANAVVLVYDATSAATLDALSAWHDEVIEHAGRSLPTLLVGTHGVHSNSDVKRIPDSVTQRHATEWGATHVLVSNHSGVGCQAAVKALVALVTHGEGAGAEAGNGKDRGRPTEGSGVAAGAGSGAGAGAGGGVTFALQ